MTYQPTNIDHAYDYRSTQLDLTCYWDLRADECVAISATKPNLPQLALDYVRGQNRICR